MNIINHTTKLLVAFACLMVLAPCTAQADDDAPGNSTAGGEREHHLRLEFKREATNRGSAEESSKTQIKIDALLGGAISLLRLELPFPDKKSTFEGDPFNPRLGDIKTRLGFRSLPLAGIPCGSFLELTFPTASSKELGSGKYQVAPGIKTDIPIWSGQGLWGSHQVSFEPSIKQIVSVAGDEDRKDINYAKIELSLRDTWIKEYWLKFTPNLVVDWQQNARTGAVAELEAGKIISSQWRLWILLGTELWGQGLVPSTYDKRVGFNISYVF